MWRCGDSCCLILGPPFRLRVSGEDRHEQVWKSRDVRSACWYLALRVPFSEPRGVRYCTVCGGALLKEVMCCVTMTFKHVGQRSALMEEM